MVRIDMYIQVESNRYLSTCYNSLHVSGECCHPQIAFSNSLNPDQDQQIVGILTFISVINTISEKN